MHTKLNIATLIVGCIFVFSLVSCNKNSSGSNRWDVEVDSQSVSLAFSDISADIFDSKKPIPELRSKYPLFFSSNKTDTVYEEIRRDSLLKSIYQDQKKVFSDYDSLKNQLVDAFARIKYYYPNWVEPKVFVYSSDLTSLYDPILYLPDHNSLFIALDAFLGKNSSWYKKSGVEPYLLDEMTPSHVLPKIVDAIARQMLPASAETNFLSHMIYEGKILLFKDAVLPSTLDSIKIGYTSNEYSWCFKQEYYIWSYFLQSDLLYDSDKDLLNRFLTVGPYSKFYNEIQTESPSRIGAWVGWQIVRKYAENNKEKSLMDLLNTKNHEKLFLDSNYKPKE